MEIINQLLERKQFKKYDKIKNFDIGIYHNSDFNALLRLYNSVFPGYMSIDLWKWKNTSNPFGDFYTILMKEKESIIAAYSVAPKIFYIFGKKYPCVQSMDTMTEKEYRGRGISTYLANLTYEYAKILGANFVYGFPNKVSKYLFEVKLNWNNFGEISLFYKNITPNSRNLDLKNKYNIKEVNSFDEEINEFWEKYKNDYSIIIKKDKDYLNWRYVNHPLVQYRIFLIYDETSDEIISYFILKKFQGKDRENIGHIVDYVIGPQDKKIKLQIFEQIENFSFIEFKEYCSKISLWIFDDDLIRLAQENLGYKKTQMETNFGFKIFRNKQQLNILNSLKNWKLTMSNNDVF